ncbi:hypothetical protein VNI00_012885 [Paramarasmius palmivorus]|uniref:Uncharacterized protein n=1 Tax=Paramarasmius palmivorus TaxID=297713 RepID=A0AAW0C1X7_9AGAR
MAFSGCSAFTIHNGHFTNIQGSQHIHIQGDVIHESAQEEEVTNWNDYRRLRTGDIRILRQIGINDTLDSPSFCWNTESWKGKVVARRTFSVARVFGDNEGEFLHVGYSGRGAFEAFQEDMEQFSIVKNASVAQLFGYNNRRSLPALIFYEALVPLLLIRDHSDTGSREDSLIFNLYCALQLHVTQLIDDIDITFRSGDIWIDPRTGTFHKGPSFKDFSDAMRTLPSESELPSGSNVVHQPLSIQAFSDNNTVLDYMSRVFPVEVLFDIILRFGTWRGGGVDLHEVFKRLVGFVHGSESKVRNHITRPQRRFTNVPSYLRIEGSYYPSFDHRVTTPMTVLENGLFRFQFSRLPLSNDGHVSIIYTLNVGTWWLSQIHLPFSNYDRHRDSEWSNYYVPYSFELDFFPDEEAIHLDKEANRSTNESDTVYLFIRPVPPLSDGESAWQSWIAGPKYYWSFDRTGEIVMSERGQVLLGLPSFGAHLSLNERLWCQDDYDDIKHILKVKGMDHKLTAWAQSLGFPVEFVGRDVWFWDSNSTDLEWIDTTWYGVDDRSDSDSPTGTSESGCFQDESEDDFHSSDTEDVDDEVVLYPRFGTKLALAASHIKPTTAFLTRRNWDYI